ncbi:LacI family DNA-binding transcriptional regulator [Pontivivens ytuae]|uniref:LacI family DNA-binding transcriptional regulator n=1 Tax=Pontivivens ytuae TaxID=2789856 RepID=A0A7S9LP61_9RHOB|nr:LacI family DNA-binding transcriptional regulator [Pontivivens ytuae]QPH52230.1 LacI family DNA-binding transcriptional regulator [Pontivivens ytuae]
MRKRGNTGAKRPTLADVAALAGVSAITVSRALRDPQKVSPQLQEQIAHAVQKLGYAPDPAASALASGRSNTIGLVIPSLTNSVFSEVLRGVYDALEETAYSAQIGNFRYAPLGEEKLLLTFRSQRPAGLIVAGTDQTAGSRRLLEEMACPVVQIMDIDPDPIDMIVGFSHHDAGAAAARHLVEAGYRRIGLLAARMDPRTQKRAAGFRTAAGAATGPEREVMTPEASTTVLGGHMMAELLAKAPDTDAIFCINDDLAAGALFECQRRGIAVPERMGICGFNDLDIASAVNPPLTSVFTPRYEMGRRAVELLLARIGGAAEGPVVEDIGFQLRPRGSTATKG